MYDEKTAARAASLFGASATAGATAPRRRQTPAADSEGFSQFLNRSLRETERIDRSARQRVQSMRDERSPELFSARDDEKNHQKITPRQKRHILHEIQQAIRSGVGGAGLPGAVCAAAQAAGVSVSGAVGIMTEAALRGDATANAAAEINADAVEAEALAAAAEYFWDLLFNPGAAPATGLEATPADSCGGLAADPSAGESALDWFRNALRALAIDGGGAFGDDAASADAFAAPAKADAAMPADAGKTASGDAATPSLRQAKADGDAAAAGPNLIRAAEAGVRRPGAAMWGVAYATGAKAANGVPVGASGGFAIPGGMPPNLSQAYSGSSPALLAGLPTPGADSAAATLGLAGKVNGAPPTGIAASSLGEGVTVVAAEHGAGTDADGDGGDGEDGRRRAERLAGAEAAHASARRGAEAFEGSAAGGGLPETVARQGVSEEVARQIAQASDALKWVQRNGGRQVTVRFSTEEMGEMRLKVSSRRGKVSATLTVSNAEAGGALRGGLADLKDTLAAQGVTLETFDIEVDEAEAAETAEAPPAPSMSFGRLRETASEAAPASTRKSPAFRAGNDAHAAAARAAEIRAADGGLNLTI